MNALLSAAKPYARPLRPAYRRMKGLARGQAAGMTSSPERELLARYAAAVTDGCIVEIGCYRGASSVALGRAARVPVYSVDPQEEFVGVNGGQFGPEDRGAYYQAMLRTGCYRNVRLVNLPSTEAAQGWSRPVGMLWIDGDHAYQAVKADVEAWLPHLLSDATLLFDDMQCDGPARVVGELDGWEITEQVGKIAALRAT